MDQLLLPNDNLPTWLCTSFINDEQVFLPCGVFGNELKETLCLIFDRVSVVQHEGHVYAPADWLAREYPSKAKDIRTMVIGAREKLRIARVVE